MSVAHCRGKTINSLAKNQKHREPPSGREENAAHRQHNGARSLLHANIPAAASK
jgi:hypothetical protein